MVACISVFRLLTSGSFFKVDVTNWTWSFSTLHCSLLPFTVSYIFLIFSAIEMTVSICPTGSIIRLIVPVKISIYEGPIIVIRIPSQLATEMVPLLFVLVLVLVMPSRGLYTVEVDRVGVDGMNVLFDSYHHPETSDFGINNGMVCTAHTHAFASSALLFPSFPNQYTL